MFRSALLVALSCALCSSASADTVDRQLLASHETGEVIAAHCTHCSSACCPLSQYKPCHCDQPVLKSELYDPAPAARHGEVGHRCVLSACVSSRLWPRDCIVRVCPQIRLSVHLNCKGVHVLSQRRPLWPCSKARRVLQLRKPMLDVVDRTL